MSLQFITWKTQNTNLVTAKSPQDQVFKYHHEFTLLDTLLKLVTRIYNRVAVQDRIEKLKFIYILDLLLLGLRV